ncbi:pol, partial [Symbiodinium pilosum]
AIKLMARRAIELSVLDEVAAEIQPKHLRWFSELLADGSVLRSLSGRTKDLQGLIGQLRGFSLEEFLGEEEPGKVIPWSLLSDVESAIEPKDLVTGKTVRYSGPEGALRAGLLHERMLKTTELSKFCPAAYRLPGCEPPFEDLEGTGLHFEKQGKARLDG